MQHVPETELVRYLVQKASILLFFSVFPALLGYNCF